MILLFAKLELKKKYIGTHDYRRFQNKIIKKRINKDGYYNNKNGKPILINNEKNISITNNNRIIIIATNDKLIGIDLQLIKKNTKLTLEEIRSFSMKEALFKAYNMDYQELKKFNYAYDKINIIKIGKYKFKLFSKVVNKYVLSICYQM